MAQTEAERQKAYRERKRANSKRLDLLIPTSDMELFSSKVKQSGLTRVEYFISLLRGNRSLQQTTFIPNDEAQEQAATIERLQNEVDALMEDKAIFIKVNKDQKSEIDDLKQFGASKHKDDEATKLRKTIQLREKTMQLREKTYNNLTGKLNAEIKLLKAKPHICQALLQRNEKRCTTRATHDVNKNGFVIHVCGRHYKTVTA